MKKNVTILLVLLFCGFICNAQDTFVKKYTTCITEVDNKLSDWENIDLTVVFNEKHTNNVVLYYPNKKIILYKIGNIETSKTKGGEEYQLIECLDDDGNKLALQLFSKVMRIIIGKGYVEFHE